MSLNWKLCAYLSLPFFEWMAVIAVWQGEGWMKITCRDFSWSGSLSFPRTTDQHEGRWNSFYRYRTTCHNLQQRAPAVPLFLKIHHTGGDKTEGIIGIDCAVVVQHRMHLASPFGQAAISWGSGWSGCLSELLRMCFISLAVYIYTVMGMAPGEFET